MLRVHVCAAGARIVAHALPYKLMGQSYVSCNMNVVCVLPLFIMYNTCVASLRLLMEVNTEPPI